MALAQADLESDLFYAEGATVHKRGAVEHTEDGQPTGAATEGFWVCECSDFIEGAAEQIARALNRLPKAEAMLVELVGAIRGQKEARSWGAEPRDLNKLADEIEAFILDGVA